ncbi:MAG: transcriptional regulator FtsR [Mycobacteriales bacterium]
MSTAPATGGAAYLSIGELIKQLRDDFPDLTISKIRFLEAEGLLAPHRAPSGYRRFTRADADRLRYVLRAQRDHYLPLRVIREHLDAMDRGMQPPDNGASTPAPPRLPTGPGLPAAEHFAAEVPTVRLTRAELLADAGIDDTALSQLEQFGMIDGPAPAYDGVALMVARAVGRMARFGIEPRHLRAFRTAADREIGLYEQVLTPLVRQRGEEAQQRARRTASELAALSVELHAALVRHRLGDALSG